MIPSLFTQGFGTFSTVAKPGRGSDQVHLVPKPSALSLTP